MPTNLTSFTRCAPVTCLRRHFERYGFEAAVAGCVPLFKRKKASSWTVVRVLELIPACEVGNV